MPIMYGLAAFAVLATGYDQSGVDPQIDKQYAIVKQGGGMNPNIPPSVTEDSNLPAKLTGECTAPQARATSYNLSQSSHGLSISQGSTAGDCQIAISLATQGASASSPTLAFGSAIDQTGRATDARPSIALFSGNNLAQLKGMDRMVSVQFNNASAADVLKWLTKQNVNFVANVDKLPKTKITMNVKNVPLHEALSSVAETLGGSWQVRGTTLIFQSGMFRTFNYGSAMSPFGSIGDAKAFGQLKGKNSEPLALMNEQQLKAFEKQMFDLKTNLKELPKMDPKALAEMKSLHGFTQDGKLFEFKMDPKALAEMRALQGELFTKEGKLLPNKGGDPFLKLKGMEDMKALKGELFTKDGKALAPLGGDPFMKLKGLNEMKSLSFKKIDTDKFIKSLTSGQKDLMKKQGYLKFSDLTDAQKAMMFDGSTKELPQDFTFVFSVNGEKITIKKQ